MLAHPFDFIRKYFSFPQNTAAFHVNYIFHPLPPDESQMHSARKRVQVRTTQSCFEAVSKFKCDAINKNTSEDKRKINAVDFQTVAGAPVELCGGWCLIFNWHALQFELQSMNGKLSLYFAMPEFHIFTVSVTARMQACMMSCVCASHAQHRQFMLLFPTLIMNYATDGWLYRRRLHMYRWCAIHRNCQSCAHSGGKQNSPILTRSLAGHIARVHATSFQDFNDFTSECADILFYLVHIVFGDTLWLGFSLFNCHISSHQISHYLLCVCMCQREQSVIMWAVDCLDS